MDLVVSAVVVALVSSCMVDPSGPLGHFIQFGLGLFTPLL